MKDIVSNFLIEGSIFEIEENSSGLVNKTYIINTTKSKYLLQKINQYVFKKPNEVMENIELVTDHLKNKNIRTLDIIKTKDLKSYYFDNTNYYRMYKYMSDLENVNLDFDKVCLEVGKSIGKFQLDLFDLDIEKLYDTIPNFHNFLSRINDLITSYKNSTFDDIRKYNSTKYYNYILSNVSKNMVILNNIKKGLIPIRVTHNDTKLNNILFNKITKKAECLIDLDTVMPGSLLFDYGDACRSSIVTVDENSKDIQNIDLNDKKFIYLTIGYLSKVKELLNEVEVENLVDSIGLIIMECATRFLTDYLDHDVYFKTDYQEQNLDRVINQLTLYERYLNKENLYKEYVRIILNRL